MAHAHHFDKKKISQLINEYGGSKELAHHLGVMKVQVENWAGGSQSPSIKSLELMMNKCNLKPGYFFREVKR